VINPVIQQVALLVINSVIRQVAVSVSNPVVQQAQRRPPPPLRRPCLLRSECGIENN
jgi:hypothetical protein